MHTSQKIYSLEFHLLDFYFLFTEDIIDETKLSLKCPNKILKLQCLLFIMKIRYSATKPLSNISS